jgi:hypothetical protein
MTPFRLVLFTRQFSVPDLFALGYLRFVRPPTREAFLVCERPTNLSFTAVLARFAFAPVLFLSHASPPV